MLILQTKVEGVQNLGKPADVILDHFQTCSNKVSRVFKGYFKVVFKYFKGNSRKFKVLSNKFQSVSAQLFEQKEGLFGLNSFSMRNIEDREEKTGGKLQ